MNRTELTLIVAAVFIFAIALGWVLRWMFTRLNQSALGGTSGSNDLATRLLAAEDARDQAFANRDATVKDIQNKLTQTQAELDAAMGGLGDARREADALRIELRDLRE